MFQTRLLAVSLVLNAASFWMWILEYENNAYLQAWVQQNIALSSADLTALVGGMIVGFLGYGGFYFGKKVRARRLALSQKLSVKVDGPVERVKTKKRSIREL